MPSVPFASLGELRTQVGGQNLAAATEGNFYDTAAKSSDWFPQRVSKFLEASKLLFLLIKKSTGGLFFSHGLLISIHPEHVLAEKLAQFGLSKGSRES